MKTSPAGRRLIAKHEGMILRVYADPAGFSTVGIGHLIAKRAPTQADREKWEPMTEAQALELLAIDLVRFEDAINRLVEVPLTQNRFDALVSLSFNIGTGAFESSTLLSKLNDRDYAGAANEFGRWNRAGGRVLAGLNKRRAEEAALFRSQPSISTTVPESKVTQSNESREVGELRSYAINSGVPHRVTSAVRSKLPSRHAQKGTKGLGLAVDFAGPKPGSNTPEMLAIFKAFESVESQLYELIYSGAPYSIKRGKRVKRYAISDHWDHVHVSVDKGVFVRWPSVPEQSKWDNEEEDMPISFGVKGKGVFVCSQDAKRALLITGSDGIDAGAQWGRIWKENQTVFVGDKPETFLDNFEKVLL